MSLAEAYRRLRQYGPNLLEVVDKVRWYQVFARQFVNILILILLVAAGISFAIGGITDAITILVIVLLNGVLGFVQEWRAERALEALQRMLALRSRVLRDGEEQIVDARDLTPGDVVLLEVGDRVPADLRLSEVLNLQVDESSLTGESVPIYKDRAPVDSGAPLAERSSMVWMGTVVTNGRARGIVVGTGMDTEFGRIAQVTRAVGEEVTPLQHRLGVLGKQLGAIGVIVSLVVAVTGWLLGKPLLEMILTGISLAVAVVPEGLPAVVTITLALGVRAMVRRSALLRRLQAAETLGAATVICTDKTGTLTKNEMTVQRIWLPSRELEVTGVGYAPEGEFRHGDERISPGDHPDLRHLLETGLRCNRASVTQDETGWYAVGDPTEAALVVAARKGGLDSDGAPQLVNEFSFDSRRKRMTVIQEHSAGLIAHVKGAPEVVLERCTRLLKGGEERDLSDADREAAISTYERLAGEGLRTLALARRVLPRDAELGEDQVERDLTLLGLVGIIDPPRREVPEAVQLAYSAGIRVLMITGDASATALAVAKKIGLRARRAVTSRELAAMDDEELRAALEEEAIFSRVAPEHKMRIVTLLQGMGDVVAMTGDGVNDAPALKKADVGTAMGLRGTDVAKGASDMILLDDNFATIIGAVEEGRRQYDNIQKFVRYLLSSNTAEIVAIFLNIVLGGPLILLPVQILWINLVTDGMTAVALGVEPAERGIMERRPRPPRAPLLDHGSILRILLLGGYMGLGTLWLFRHYLAAGIEDALPLAQTAAFTGLVLIEKVNVFNFRSLRQPLTRIGFFSNPLLLIAWVVSAGLQACAVYVPFLQRAMHTVPLRGVDWALMVLVAAPILVVGEVYKWSLRRRERREAVPAHTRDIR
ncbi:ATPase P [candidate division TA06 bacterium SM23_40]|uniref:ATPase P n=1 Tax=candidate division TA06 bacterium SM23_40 TaxID=1703774 RepID=A0A0S8GC59_UNCT6|nr:MAG: ATPase P [candidate division TA06 bacterium SM23_40]